MKFAETYADYKRINQKPRPKKEVSLIDLIDRRTKQAVKKMTQLEIGEQLSTENINSATIRYRRELERRRLERRQYFLNRLNRGEILISDLPRDAFPEYFIRRTHVNSWSKWEDHIHHHIRVEMNEDENAFFIYCDTCEPYSTHPITTVYMDECDYTKMFHSHSNCKRQKSYCFFTCVNCKCQITIKQFYQKYQLKRCPNCESPDIEKCRNLELHDPEIFKLLRERELIYREINAFMAEKQKELEKYKFLDSRTIILTKYGKITKADYDTEKQRNRLVLTLRDDHPLKNNSLISMIPKFDDHAKRLPKYNPELWTEKRKLKKRGPKLKLSNITP